MTCKSYILGLWAVAIFFLLGALAAQAMWVYHSNRIHRHGTTCTDQASMVVVQEGFKATAMPLDACLGLGFGVLVLIWVVMYVVFAVSDKPHDSTYSQSSAFRHIYRIFGYSFAVVAAVFIESSMARMYSPEYKLVVDTGGASCGATFREESGQITTFVATVLFAIGVIASFMMGFLSKDGFPNETVETVGTSDYPYSPIDLANYGCDNEKGILRDAASMMRRPM
jgi:hypothetical protein